MCGIAGILERERGRPVRREAVEIMMAALRHRGPDAAGMHLAGAVGLDHQRRSIIDLGTGHQPMTNEDGSLWIVFNGEIYNYLELRRDLTRQHTFKTHSDTEVILHLYEELGERCLERLNGMFALAIWDARQQRLFAARDRMGIKPFYWHLDGERFSFASEQKAFLAADLAVAKPDPQGLEEYLTFQFCLGERTLFKDIWRLPPAHYLTFRPFRDSEPAIVRYWDFNYELDTHHTEEYYAEQLLLLLQDAVRLQLRSDVPVGAHLSGGIDSSTVVSLAAPLYGGAFHTFTGAFREGPQYDETAYARAVAERVQSIHHEVWPTAADFVDAMPRLISAMDEPAAGPWVGTIPDLTLLLSYRPLLQTFWRDGRFGEMDERYFRLVSRLEDADSLMTPEVWNAESRDRMLGAFREIFNDPATKSYFNKMTNFDLKTLLPALLHVEDRTSMSVSLESRVPLLDHRIAELVTRMPPTIRFKGGEPKRVFREAVRHVLPEAVFNRQDKMGFPVPLTEWFRGPLRDFLHDVLLSSRARQRGIYRIAEIERLIAREQAFGRQLWGLLSLELWFRAFVDGEGIPTGG